MSAQTAPHDDARSALERLRNHVALTGPELLGDVEAIDAALSNRDALKKASDAIVELISHPSRDVTPMLQAVVEYRKLAERLAE